MASLQHRGPDSEGVWEDPVEGISLGHKRLAVIDVSPAGHQPMRSADRRHVLTFNGEIYNFREVRQELEAAGVRFRSSSDTEVLLEGYALWGEAVLDRLVGQFAFALWDSGRRRLFLARDRMGEKPLYYAATSEGFVFASELQAFRHVPGVDLSVDETAVQLYLEHQYVPAPKTIYRGVKKLLPAHAMTVEGRDLTTWRYWDPIPFALEPTLDISQGQALEELERLLRRSVEQQMIADVPLGAFLSGGIDSSTVVAMMTEVSNAEVRTFTIGFDIEEYSEATHAAAVAATLGTNHTCEYLTVGDALELVPGIPGMYGEPFADYSALPTQLVSAVARKHVTVSLSGDGGDELFGGYQRYDQYMRLAAATRWLGPVPALVAPALTRAPGRIGRLAGHVVAGRHRDPYHPLVSAFNSVEVEELTGRAQPPYAQYDRAWRGAASLPAGRRAMATDLMTYLPEAILAKVDRAAMAASLEVRAPFLDHRLVEWSLRLPPALVREKALLKAFAYTKVPRSLLERPKQGFGVPLSHWFKADLREQLHDALSPARLEPFGVSNTAAVQRYLAEHMSGRREHAGKLWTLMVLSLWGSQAS